MAAIATLEDAREAARRRLPRVAFDFIEGGAGGEVTLRGNDGRLRPADAAAAATRRRLRATASSRVLGQEIAMPILIAPTGMARIAGEGGEAGGRARGGPRRHVSRSARCRATRSRRSRAAAERAALVPALPLARPRDHRQPAATAPGGGLPRARHDRRRGGGRHAACATSATASSSRRAAPAAALDLLRHPRWLRARRPPR